MAEELKTGLECIRADSKQMEQIQKTFDMLIGHTTDKTKVAEQHCAYRGRHFGIKLIELQVSEHF